MQLTRAADYAVRVMIHMATLPPGARVPLGTLAAAVAVPESFLSKVLQALTRSGLLVSRRGTEGGFEVAPGTAQVNMLDVIQAIDGPIQLNVCLRYDGSCKLAGSCPAHSVWVRAQEAMVRVLSSAVISDLARHSRSSDEVMLTPHV